MKKTKKKLKKKQKIKMKTKQIVLKSYIDYYMCKENSERSFAVCYLFY